MSDGMIKKAEGVVCTEAPAQSFSVQSVKNNLHTLQRRTGRVLRHTNPTSRVARFFATREEGEYQGAVHRMTLDGLHEAGRQGRLLVQAQTAHLEQALNFYLRVEGGRLGAAEAQIINAQMAKLTRAEGQRFLILAQELGQRYHQALTLPIEFMRQAVLQAINADLQRYQAVYQGRLEEFKHRVTRRLQAM